MTGIYFSIDETPEGHLQLSIDDENAGYRICGPKYDGRSKNVIRHFLTLNDIEEIESYLRSAKTTLRSAARALPSQDGSLSTEKTT